MHEILDICFSKMFKKKTTTKTQLTIFLSVLKDNNKLACQKRNNTKRTVKALFTLCENINKVKYSLNSCTDYVSKFSLYKS
jgi:RNase P protein component